MEELNDEELGAEELQLIQKICDDLAAFANQIGALAGDVKRELDRQIENHGKRTDSERKAMLIERLFRRYDPCSAEIYDHLPYLEQRLRRIHRAGRPKSKRPRSKSVAASRISTPSRRT